jgi:hypothetical protein
MQARCIFCKKAVQTNSMRLPSCTKHRKLSYYVVLTPKGTRFSGYGKRLAKQLGVSA